MKTHYFLAALLAMSSTVALADSDDDNDPTMQFPVLASGVYADIAGGLLHSTYQSYDFYTRSYRYLGENHFGIDANLGYEYQDFVAAEVGFYNENRYGGGVRLTAGAKLIGQISDTFRIIGKAGYAMGPGEMYFAVGTEHRAWRHISFNFTLQHVIDTSTAGYIGLGYHFAA